MNNSDYSLKDLLKKFEYLTKYDLKFVREIMEAIEYSIKRNLATDKSIPNDQLELLIQNLINIYLIGTDLPSCWDLYLFKSVENLIKQPNLLQSILNANTIKSFYTNQKTNFLYTSDFDKNYNYAITESIASFKNYLKPEIKEKIMNETLSNSELKLIQSKVISVLKTYFNELYQTVIRDGYIHRISNCARILDVTGNLYKNNEKNNKRLQPANYDFLGFNYMEDKNDALKRPYILALENPEFLKQFSNEELIALSAFYTNKVAKATKRYNYCLYILYKTHLIDKYIEDPNYTFDLSDKEIAEILMQHKFLTRYAEKYINARKKERKNENSMDDSEEINLEHPVIKNAEARFSKDYNDEFPKIMPNYEHDFLDDLTETIELESSSQYAYDAKMHSVESLLFMLMEKDKEINWGIILEKNPNQNVNKNFDALIGFDMKEFNMPIKLHCSRWQIQNFLKHYTGSSIIPLYRGNNDMFVSDIYLSTQVAMKLSKDQRKILRETAQSIQPHSMYYKFINHLQWMSHPKKIPKFIPQERTYYDFNTKQILSKEEYDKLQKSIKKDSR